MKEQTNATTANWTGHCWQAWGATEGSQIRKPFHFRSTDIALQKLSETFTDGSTLQMGNLRFRDAD